ncbi:MAG: hypothetical protein NC390_02640 [Fusobacterium sp.]|nr:hypothetical protein [Fusobacterium sp.]
MFMRVNNYNSFSFGGARLAHQSFENFRDYAVKNNFLENFPQLINPDNFVNEGRFNTVYRIPDNPDFLLRVKKIPQPKNNAGFGPVVDVFPNLNVGQEIARLNDDVTVVIFQAGKPCGIRHHVGDMLFPVNQNDIKQFLNYIETISSFPQRAYDDFVEEAKIVSKPKRIDWFNPQNVLYDEANKCFNIVDISDKGRLGSVMSPMLLKAQLCDNVNLFDILKMSNEQEKQRIIKAARTVIQKIDIASKEKCLDASIKPYIQKMYSLICNRNPDVLKFLRFNLFTVF